MHGLAMRYFRSSKERNRPLLEREPEKSAAQNPFRGSSLGLKSNWDDLDDAQRDEPPASIAALSF
jgi:hypothetical protein